VGHGIGPALEARDVLAVLQGKPDAPKDLRDRAVLLAGRMLELSGYVRTGEGSAFALTVLEDGHAWKKFQAICKAQGGLREPAVASHQQEVVADKSGRVSAIDNRRLAKLAKLAGAPNAPAAGIDLHAHVGDRVEKGKPVMTIHAEAPGELAYALRYLSQHPDLIQMDASEKETGK
jgi:thymidine phosphorylase